MPQDLPDRRPISQQPRVRPASPTHDPAFGARLAEAFLGGRSIAALCRRYRLPRDRIRSLLADAGVRSRRALIGFDDHQMSVELAGRVRGGATLAGLAAQTGLSRARITALIRAIEGPPPRRAGLLDDRLDELAVLYNSGSSIADIAAQVGTSGGTVRRALLAAGVTLRGRGPQVRHPRSGWIDDNR